MAVRFTEEQRRVIESRKQNLLVSAAAGSGKTAVLVERIISLITDKERPLDIDRLLVVTFTNAAAAEMRERIGIAIEERLKKEPESLHLQRQATLLHHAQITTIDSFCLFVIRNNFNDIGLDPGFRVADTGELELVKQDIIRELFEEYLQSEETKESFAFLLDTMAPGGREKALEDIILDIHAFAESYPWPKEWLNSRLEDYEVGEGIEKTPWGDLLHTYLRLEWEQLQESLEAGLAICHEPDGPLAYAAALHSDLEQIELLAAKTWEEQYEQLQKISYARLSAKKQEGVSEEKKGAVKALRDRVKEDIKGIKKKYFSFSPAHVLKQMEEIKELEKVLIEAVLTFGERFALRKREKNLVDFGDMEHFALKILTERTEDAWMPSKTARDYMHYFQEIMIDEYQDSNLVQEYILQSISGEWEGSFNRFMVGDLKQSIYKFRMARPEIFLEKYETYSEEEGDCQCIHLHKNFRSRKQVLDSANDVFYQLMGKQIGKIDYTEKEALYPGAEFPEGKEEQKLPQRACLEGEEEAKQLQEAWLEEKEEAKLPQEAWLEEKEGYTTELLLLEKPEREERKEEARMVARRINQLVGSLPITDKETGKLRPARYRDMVILLRANTGWDEVFYQQLAEAGIPAILTSKTGYFHAKEVQIVLNFLRVIDNPRQDIPLYGVMTSLLGRFTAEEAAIMKKAGKESLYDNLTYVSEIVSGEEELAESNDRLLESADRLEKNADRLLEGAVRLPEELIVKARRLLCRLNHYRDRVAVIPIHQLLREYLKETGYLYYFGAMPAGGQRAANVKMLLKKAEAYEKTSYFGLFYFIRYMEQLQKYEVDTGEASITDEDRDAVRIMTIHKSKGLEFPVCFVSGLHKKFNQMDSRQACIMDMDMGLGLEYRNAEKRIHCTDLRKSIIARKMKLENLGEELRVLYVAMTRAREKLILTGIVNEYEKQMLSYAALKSRKEIKLPFWVLSHGSSYLDYLLAATVRPCPSIKTILWNPHKAERETMGEAVESQMMRLQVEEWLEKEQTGEEWISDDARVKERSRMSGAEKEKDAGEIFARLKEALAFTYQHKNLQGLYAKTTVSELKMKAMEEAQEGAASLFEESAVIPYLPRFMEKESKVSGTARGTAYHRVLELMDFSGLTDWTGLEKEMEALSEKGILDPGYLPLIQKEKMEVFLSSSLAKRMQKADKEGGLYKEKPFVLGLPASLLDPAFPNTEKVLIQGIIDAFFEEEGELVLVDYKTDRISQPQELVTRYREQLQYYQMALEQLTGRRVKEKLLYSFALGEVVECC